MRQGNAVTNAADRSSWLARIAGKQAPRWICVLALVSVAGARSAAESPMTLPGSFSVSATGAAQYDIAIAVPPGTAGMAPTLSLEYHSQGGDGLLGIGWSLGGLPSIVRCAQTATQDGVVGGVNYDGNDRFCLDGQRLIAISGAYGADGTEYRTEVESFSRVISHGAAGNGPAWFEIHTKSGQIMELGRTADSQIFAPGTSTARTWAVDKVSDTKGNYYSVTYNNDTNDGEFFPVEIDYTGNAAAGLAPYHAVRFVYAARPDVQYPAGSLTRLNVLLTDIDVYAGGVGLVTDYKLAYQQSGSTSRSHIVSIAKCDGAGNCLPATTFTWQDGTTTLTDNANIAAYDGQLANNWVMYPADFNGDGKTDLLFDLIQPASAGGGGGEGGGVACTANSFSLQIGVGFVSSSAPSAISDGQRRLWLGHGDGAFTGAPPTASYDGLAANSRLYLGDFNGDGKTDLLYDFVDSGRSTGQRQLWLSNGDGSFNIKTISPSGLAGANLYVADFAGTGKTGLLLDQRDSNGCSTGSRQIWFSNGDGTFNPVDVSPSGLAAWKLSIADFNGDGKADLLFEELDANDGSTTGHRQIWFGNGDGTFNAVTVTPNSPANWRTSIADFNGDGKADLLAEELDSSGTTTGNRQVWLSHGDGAFSAVNATPNGLAGWQAYAVDFNSDGKADLLFDQVDSNGIPVGHRQIWYGNGDGTFNATLAPSDGSLARWVPYLVDVNGDGKADFLFNQLTSDGSNTLGNHRLWLSDGQGVDQIVLVTTGLGANTAITYVPLTSSSAYMADTNAVYPLRDVQAPIYVVSRVDASNGLGSAYSTTYAYAGAKFDVSGGGFLGFRQTTMTDLQTNIALTTNFRQDFPFGGLVVSSSKALGAQVLN
jgi:hypothetical protein